MNAKSSHDPVRRQADALTRLWGVAAPSVAERYLAEARKGRKTDRITYWEQVLTALGAEAAAPT